VHSQNIIRLRTMSLGHYRPRAMTGRWLSAMRTRLGQRLDLLLEFIVLRHQLAVLQRTGTRRPCFRPSERLFWVFLSRWWANWQRGLIIVQPATVLRWRRCATKVRDGIPCGLIEPSSTLHPLWPYRSSNRADRPSPKGVACPAPPRSTPQSGTHWTWPVDDFRAVSLTIGHEGDKLPVPPAGSMF
jgi:hypothetical protein